MRIGKHITFDVEADSLEVAESKVDTACKKMLCNQIMESYSFKVSKHTSYLLSSKFFPRYNFLTFHLRLNLQKTPALKQNPQTINMLCL